MKSFGFEDVQSDLNKLAKNAEDIKPETKKYAIKMRDRARQIAQSKKLVRSGAGVSGIEVEDTETGTDVGWSQRPNFHLYFHELGFHALDNRRGRIRLSRNSKGKRARIYSSSKATYVSPKPHIRPAFDAIEPEFYKAIQKTLEKGVS
ncbi:hypothetical protein LZ578_08620 [Jeotgalibaca sp. MA1X17-3]|uniref:hypothetical protein n=1 Tax=Jeotgalibaca sp. MA1X17-3 TaxID=2908211 RepID=UPI001F1C119A|nr:hypothetical protein [Jeotgalibaca sp. MA1X17-3]UJF15062.1 hypothetical protein LZ578_08620 [Jeotgalibaca sp. MA1X17-3]